MAIATTDLRTLISDANSTTGWTGSNGVDLFTAQPTPVYQTGCIGTVVSNATEDVYFTMGSPVDMSGGLLVYVWVFLRGEMDTTANGGAQIMLGDGTNRIGFHLAGSDLAAFRHDQGPVGWQCMVLDTANLPANTTARAGSLGGLNLSAITQVGAVFKTLVKSVGGTENCFVDVMRYGNGGIRVTGGTSGDPADLEQLAAQDRSNANAYGIVRRLGAGAFGAQGSLIFGGAATYFRQQNAAISFEDRSLNVERYSMTVEGADVTFHLGSKVGVGDTATGANGVNVTVPPGVGASFTATNDDFRVYGSALSGFTGGVTLPDDATAEFIGSRVAGSGRLLSRSTELRDATVSGSVDPDGALLWTPSTDLRNSSFADNPRGILHTDTGTFDYVGLSFSGNDFDVRNDSGGLVTINLSNSDTPTVDNVGASTTEVQVSATHSLTNLQEGTRVTYVLTGTADDVFHVASVGVGGRTDYTYTEPQNVDIFIHHIEYVHIEFTNVELAGVDAEIPIFQARDRVYANPD